MWVAGSSAVPKLTKEDGPFVVYTLNDWLPSLDLLFRVDSRDLGVAMTP